MDIVVLFFDVLLIIVVLILKSILLRWLAVKKNWDKELKTSILVNVYWLLIVLGISIIFTLVFPIFISIFAIDYYNDFLMYTFVQLTFFGFNLLIGYFLIFKYYKGSHFDSFVISLIILITEKAFILLIQSISLIIFGLFILDGIYIFFPY